MNVKKTINAKKIVKPLILNGQTARDFFSARLRKTISTFGNKERMTLAIIQVGDLSESNSYIAKKKMFGEKIGVKVLHKKFPNTITEDALVKEIERMNGDEAIGGIIVQLPIPANLNKQKIIDTIVRAKDVDGLTSENARLLDFSDKRAIWPATARGVLSLLQFYEIKIFGKKVVVIGRSAMVGGPIAKILSREGALVTVCHSKTSDIPAVSRTADILVVAVGKPNFITKEYVSAGQTVIDVGINSVRGDKLEEEIPKKRIVGDVDFEDVKNIVGAISPVPGGVGPMTVLSLFENLVEVCGRSQS